MSISVFVLVIFSKKFIIFHHISDSKPPSTHTMKLRDRSRILRCQINLKTKYQNYILFRNCATILVFFVTYKILFFQNEDRYELLMSNLKATGLSCDFILFTVDILYRAKYEKSDIECWIEHYRRKCCQNFVF